MSDEKAEDKSAPADRLCSEIQLFDLCELDSCRHKRGRFCSNEELLSRFENIKEEDDADSLVYEDDELEEGDDLDFDEMADDYEDGDYNEDE